MNKLAIMIPAAGASRRMGTRDKLLEPVDGAPLVFGVARRALGVCDSVFVTLPNLDSPRADALKDLNVHLIAVPDAADGMAASLRQMCLHAPPNTALMILPADMPDITADDLAKLISAFHTSNGDHIFQATSASGIPGHPVIFPPDLVPGFADLTGDRGAKSLLKANSNRLQRVPLPRDNATTDLDTPVAWAKWRAKNPSR